MKSMETKLNEEMRQLENIIKAAEKRLKDAPKGHLRISKKGEGVEYYYKSDDNINTNGKYIRKEEHKLAQRLAQRDYDEKVLKMATKRWKGIRYFLEQYRESNPKKVYDGISMKRKELLEAAIISDEEYCKKWETIEYDGKGFGDEERELYTEKGERVRSKSEKIIADKLYMLGIPYRYEYPLVLKNNIKIYPDFTILKMPERKEIYLEHLGLLDDNDYFNVTLHKLNTYQKNGIYLGVNLFLTFETNKNPLNVSALEKLLKEQFVEE